MPALDPARQLYRELNGTCTGAMRQEMRRHAAGFDSLPMLMKEDPQCLHPGGRAGGNRLAPARGSLDLLSFA